MTQDIFAIEITYFKNNGKYYTHDEFQWTGRSISGVPYMNDVVATVRGWRDHGGQGSMPGLSIISSGWDGFILVDHPDAAYPTLILPENEV